MALPQQPIVGVLITPDGEPLVSETFYLSLRRAIADGTDVCKPVKFKCTTDAGGNVKDKNGDQLYLATYPDGTTASEWALEFTGTSYAKGAELAADVLFFELLYTGSNQNIGELIAAGTGGVTDSTQAYVNSRAVRYDAAQTLTTNQKAQARANIRNYKRYTALLTQSGTDAPTAAVLENELSGAIVWSRTTAGNYVGALSGAFTANKTFILILPDAAASGNVLYASRNDSNGIVIRNYVIIDDDFGDLQNTFSLEVRVYD